MIQHKRDYQLHHLAQHLLNAGNRTRLYQLLTGSPEWMEMKFQYFHSDDSFVAEIEMALEDLKAPVPPGHVLPLLRLHTVQQVVYTRSENYTDTDLKTFVYLGHVDRAINNAKLRIKPEAQFTGLMTIVDTLAENGVYDISIVREARKVAETYPIYPSEINRDNALVRVITAFADSGSFSEAVEVHSELHYENSVMASRASIASALAHLGAVDDAVKVL